MAQLPTRSFSKLVSNFAAACQSTVLVDFSVGSVLRAVAEAVSGVATWVQAMILQVLTLTRAGTSGDADLDSWMDDYDFRRLPAVSATGIVTFARFTATQAALIPVGATVRTSDNSQSYAVTASPSHPAWNATLNGYTVPAGTLSLGVPVAAVTPGAAGNAQADTVTVITGSIPGVDTVTNSGAFASGVDAESDAAFRSRFRLYLAGLSKGTKPAYGSAIVGVRQGLQYTILENVNPAGTLEYGFATITVDDGTGSPPASLLSLVATAVDAVRPLTSRFAVLAPVPLTADVSLTVTSAAGYAHAAVAGNVGIALTEAINALALGQSLPYTILPAIAYAVDGVTNVSAVLLNGGTADLAATPRNAIVPGTVAVA